jgi:uncharacterized glyoxalase superfamily protein PhnB
MHAELRIGDSIVMISDSSERAKASSAMLHVYVPNVDAVYQKALKAGATSVMEPADMFYGDRSGGVKDPAGNTWYIATAKGDRYIPEGLHTVTVYLHPRRADPLITFLKRAFDAQEVARYASPDGVIQHASVRIGDSAIEMGEAHGPYQPTPTRFYLYLPNVDAAYQRAMNAGATSIMAPKDQPQGERVAGVKDAFGNQWFMARPLDSRS